LRCIERNAIQCKLINEDATFRTGDRAGK